MTHDTFTQRIAEYFAARPHIWIDAHDLMPIGGTFAFRTRVSNCRRRHQMVIENRQRRVAKPDGSWFIVSEYRYVPPQPVVASSLLDLCEATS